MNNQLLNTLLRLFAIIVKADGLTDRNTQLVRNFLAQQFNESTAQNYVGVFVRYVDQEQEQNDTQNIIELCNEVNNELSYEQKLFILIRVIELAFADQRMSMMEVKKIVLAARYLNIEFSEYESLYNFITTGAPRLLESHPNLIHIGLDGTQLTDAATEGNAFDHEYISILYLRTANLLIARYIGVGEMGLSGQPMKPNLVYILKPGSVIRPPREEPIYFSDILDRFLYSTREAPIVFEAKNIYFRFPEGKMGLNGVNIVEESGRMVAIMGGSGAGKSTLLNVLNGNAKPFEGDVVINGVSIYSESEEIQGVIGYVAQEDVLIEELTVYENLYFNAQLCFAYKRPHELELMVVNILQELGLYEIRDLKVGSPMNDKVISGGQRKRLNIAMELIREPAVLFVDEPTSGLSSRDSENVMDLLKELAHRGKLVFVVIHQPSSDIFKLFDRLLILDMGGYPVFYGNPTEALRYFRRNLDYVNSEQVECPTCGNINPEQIFSILESKVVDEFGKDTMQRKMSPKQWNYLFRQNFAVPEVAQQREKLQPSTNIPSKIKQFRVFVKRDLLAKLSNVSYITLSILIAPLLGLGISFLLRSTPLEDHVGEYMLYKNDDLPIYLFVAILIAFFIGLTGSSQEILKDRKLRKREQFLHLSKASYLLSKIGVLFAITAVQMLVFAFCGTWVLDIRDMYWDHWLLLFTIACYAVMMGLNLSATFNSAVTIYVAIPILLIPQIVLSGTMVSFYKLNPLISNIEVVPIISDLAASRWAYEGIAVHQFKDNKYQQYLYPHEREIANAQYKRNYYLSTLETKLGYCVEHYDEPKHRETVAKELRILKYELEKELLYFHPVPSHYRDVVNRLYMPRFNSQVGGDLQQIFDALRIKYIRREEKAVQKRDKLIKRLESQHVDLQALQMRYDNEALTQVLQNADKTKKLIEYKDRLVRIADPIFQEPRHNKFFLDYREHFYAPQKAFAGHVIDTYWFNLGVIWLMSGVFYLTLYYETFRKFLEGSVTVYNRLRRRWGLRR
jgi:ABC-type multidrug transport system ATPase subunit/uncharacterized tellurite resistance protein B-like protein